MSEPIVEAHQETEPNYETERAQRPPRAQAPPPPYPAPIQLHGEDPRRKSPLLASVLSLMPGLGQVYVGYYQRGFVHALTVGSIIAILASEPWNLRALQPMIAIFLAFFWLYNIIDAGRRASFYNYALAGGREIDLPQDFALPVHGSIPGGIALIALGVVLLANTRFGISLAWLEEWWPVAVIGFGFYLFFRSWSDRKKDTPSQLGDYE